MLHSDHCLVKTEIRKESPATEGSVKIILYNFLPPSEQQIDYRGIPYFFLPLDGMDAVVSVSIRMM